MELVGFCTTVLLQACNKQGCVVKIELVKGCVQNTCVSQWLDAVINACVKATQKPAFGGTESSPCPPNPSVSVSLSCILTLAVAGGPGAVWPCCSQSLQESSPVAAQSLQDQLQHDVLLCPPRLLEKCWRRNGWSFQNLPWNRNAKPC